MTGVYIVAIALVLATGFGLYRRAVDGRVRQVRAGQEPVGARIGADLGATATFVQFSSEACAPCRVTARVLAEVSSASTGVAHVEIDAGSRLDLVRELGISRTPTVLLLDHEGVARARIVGAARRSEVLEALTELQTCGRASAA